MHGHDKILFVRVRLGFRLTPIVNGGSFRGGFSYTFVFCHCSVLVRFLSVFAFITTGF